MPAIPGETSDMTPEPSFSGLNRETLDRSLRAMILSPSGWRGIFAASGDEESAEEEVSVPHALIAAAGAAVFAQFLGPPGAAGEKPVVILGRDSRPTGKKIAALMRRAFLASSCRVLDTGITAAPEIMAYARSAGEGKSPPRAFCYISASHNPVGHNGLKFGLDDGGVLDGPRALSLIADLRAYLDAPGAIERVQKLLSAGAETAALENAAEDAAAENKRRAFDAYYSFSLEVAASNDKALLSAIRGGLEKSPLGMAVDFNGSARAAGIDRELFTGLGIRFYAINDKAGAIAHAIIPEGSSLEPCRRFLEERRAADPSVALGYVPDCDGDRGNLVIWDERAGRARSLEAQETFALVCAAELAHLVWTGQLRYDGTGRPLTKTAVAVNGPTSMRIDRIAAAFGAEVFRAEVGEANVVNLARALREKGYIVRILGEGSNGGSITHPSAVRDPAAAVFAIIKLLTVTGGGAANRGFFDIWRERAGFTLKDEKFTLTDIIASLPRFYTTGVATDEAKRRVVTGDHALLKQRYQTVFASRWEARKEELRARWKIGGWEARACTGTEEQRRLTDFARAGTGGLKIVFLDEGGNEAAFIWMRGSKTEPVFRIMADAGDSAELERYLIAWQAEMVSAADRTA
ncbi:MAG: phosphatidylglycerol lysyltransferase [Treponema sp.]|jgi:phosphoglucomutase|nr:phosphatidylglycerol lysyltransferase [Treponema sp.]